MSKTLEEIARQLKDANKKIQLIFAFNGTGKTRLSRVFKELVAPKADKAFETTELNQKKILYYNAFTEDLFYWDNDLEHDSEHQLRIQPNSFTTWILQDQGQDQNIISHFQHYTNDKLTPVFDIENQRVIFDYASGDEMKKQNIKLSKGEESNFIWSVFYSLMNSIISELNIPEVDDRSIQEFNDLEYIFIDDPVSSLDENHLIELAVDLAQLIKSSESRNLKFIITTHNPLFYNILYGELAMKNGHILKRLKDETYDIEEKKGDANKCFSYHLYLIELIKDARANNTIQKYHFNLLRNLYEKTATFLNYPHWSELLPGDKKSYLQRIINFTSHSTLSNELVAEPTEPEKQIIGFLLNHLTENYYFRQQDEQK